MSCPGFGEVNIPSSRAFWDDCEEDEFDNVEPASQLHLNFNEGESEAPIASELFVLVEGPQITEFCNASLLQDAKNICSIPAKSSSLHLNAAKAHLLATLEEDFNNSGEITELLLPYAQLAKKVLTITVKPKMEYKSEDINRYCNEVAIVHSIGGPSGDKTISQLEAPNFISGVAAGVASWRQQMQLPFNSYVVYVDKLPIDGVTAGPLIKLLQQSGVQCSDRYVPKPKPSSYLYS
ncbi:uncharacterized protein LOC132786535 [Drosophila nasuta]|uniref:uncharacterized protein LOC132786535 n=1 Tax=Drosophila nasuta TaxID=42062 RepID=UPI00295E8423|nr:uncharacterized protein LOC132786535 [Drosophila nasuta]